MTALTEELHKLGIPEVNIIAQFHPKAGSLTPRINVEGVATGIDKEGRNIEFRPHNTGPENRAGVTDPSNAVFLPGEESIDPVSGHGPL